MAKKVKGRLLTLATPGSILIGPNAARVGLLFGTPSSSLALINLGGTDTADTVLAIGANAAPFLLRIEDVGDAIKASVFIEAQAGAPLMSVAEIIEG